MNKSNVLMLKQMLKEANKQLKEYTAFHDESNILKTQTEIKTLKKELKKYG